MPSVASNLGDVWRADEQHRQATTDTDWHAPVHWYANRSRDPRAGDMLRIRLDHQEATTLR